QHRTDRGVATRHPLCDQDHVRLVAVALGAEPMPEPTEGADHLVAHEQDAVPVTDLTDSGEISGRRCEAAAGVLYWLEVDRGDGGRILTKDRLLDLVGGPHAEPLFVLAVLGSAVEVRVRDVDRARDQR